MRIEQLSMVVATGGTAELAIAAPLGSRRSDFRVALKFHASVMRHSAR